MQAASGNASPGRWWSVTSTGNAECVGRCHAFDRSDAVVHGHQQVGLALGGKLDDVGDEAVAVFEPVGHDEIDVCAEHAQAAYAHRAGGGAVGIVVGDDEQALAIADGIRQYLGSLFDVQQTGRRQQLRQAVCDLLGMGDAARGIQPRPGRSHPGMFEGGAGVGGAGAGCNDGHGAIVEAAAPTCD